MKIQIEARVAGDLVGNHIIPAALAYQQKLISSVTGLKTIYPEKEFQRLAKPHLDIISKVSERVERIQTSVEKMIDERKKANKLEAKPSSLAYCKNVLPYLDEIRYEADKLELIVEDDLWPLPKYRELLFTR